MKEITSVQNQLIKEVHSLQQKKTRTETGLFLIEGYKGVVEAINSGLKLENIFILKESQRDISIFPEEKVCFVNEQILKKISTTESPPEIVATAHQLKFNVQDLFKQENPIIVLLENIKDPGNLGTIIRTSVAANVSGIILTDNTVDIYNPKTVRSTAANLWKLPIVYMSEKSEIKTRINALKECQFISTLVREGQRVYNYYDIDYKQPTVIMFGSEAEGISEELVKHTDKLINIPMNKNVESLNLSISVGVILYESVRQRLLK